MFLDKLKDTSTDEQLKKKIRDKKLANETDDLEIKLKEETFKYFLWIDGERASSFFAKHVLICEGATEKIFLDYLTDTIWTECKGKHIYILDALGKFNIHRYMNLFGFLGIEHSVLMDKDNDTDIHKEINAFIESKKNQYTKQIKCFDEDIEGFLGIDKPSRRDQKPLNIIYKYNQKEIAEDKINALKTLFEDLFK
jgi:predicted ATP-dependent endonuclease of OLD family